MFITVDGPDGVGKTSLSLALVKAINRYCSEQAKYTTEPTDSELGKHIRDILLTPHSKEISKLTELFIKDRVDHIRIIKNLIAENKVVICDRYKYSTIVYQQLQGEKLDRLIDLNKDFLDPDYAFILNVSDVNILLNRISSRNAKKDLFETKKMLKKAIELYSHMDSYFNNITYIDANKSLDEIQNFILAKIGYLR